MMKRILAILGAFLAILIGKISWESPAWFKHFRSRATAAPRKVWMIVLGSLVTLIVIGYGYYWYLSLPQPERVVAEITAPKLTPVDKILVPDNLNINFGTIAQGTLNPRSVAP